MSKALINLEGPQFQFKKKGTDKPIITIAAKNEKAAYKQLEKYLSKVGENTNDYEKI